MANHDVIVEQNHNLALGQSQQQLLMGGHGHELIIDQTHEQELGLGLTHEHAAALEQTHEHEGNKGQVYENGNNGLAVVQNPAHEGQELVVAEENGLAVSENQGVGDNMELTIVDETHELGIEPVHDVNDENGQLVSTPVIQQRAIATTPDYELHVGQEFPDVKSCRRALRDTAIALHFEIQTIKSDKTRFTAKCASEGCPWRIHAAKLPGVPTFTIRTIHEAHTCGGIAHLGHQQASVQWVATSVEQRLRENPNCKPKEILEEIHRVHGITLSYKQAWRGKERIMATMRGSFEEGYRLLPQYCEQVKRTNPGSIATVYGNEADNCFQRLFISFHASIHGFLNACRPLLGLDRTFLKSKYLGTLLFSYWL